MLSEFPEVTKIVNQVQVYWTQKIYREWNAQKSKQPDN